MTTAILAALALSGSLAPAAKPEFQAQTDYGQAMRQAAAEGKPMAVLIGTGDAFSKVMGDAALTDATAKLLREKFVCVTVDTSTATGAQLATQFQLTDGLVISSAGGTHQALRQAGAVSATDLAKHATAYAGATGTPATTVTAGAPVVTSTSAYTPSYTPAAPYTVYPAGYSAPRPSYGSYSTCQGGNCGTSYGGTIYGGYSFPSVSGGCANGRCPTR